MVYAIETRDLRKSFVQKRKGKQETVEAVRGVTLAVKAGEIFGFLGPNGAGKTTTLRMLTTLLPIDGGEATIAGLDLSRQAQQVRRRIGYVSQSGGADQAATGRENLMLQAQLYGLARPQAQARVEELMEMFALGDFIDRIARTYSGGQKRRLEVALGLVHRPQVLFLDEPTTGLDPQNRAGLWDHIRQLRSAGTTVFLTTHYLEEADALADRLAIMDHGRIIAEGTPQELKRQIAGDAVIVRYGQAETVEEARQRLSGQPFLREIHVEKDALHLYVEDGVKAIPRILELLQARGIPPQTAMISQPTLDDVFLKHTGRSLRDAGASGEGAH